MDHNATKIASPSTMATERISHSGARARWYKGFPSSTVRVPLDPAADARSGAWAGATGSLAAAGAAGTGAAEAAEAGPAAGVGPGRTSSMAGAGARWAAIIDSPFYGWVMQP